MISGVVEDPRTLVLAKKLGIPHLAAIGIVRFVLNFVLQKARDGEIGQFCNAQIAFEIGYWGDADKLIDALTKSGWLDENPECCLAVHDWHDWEAEALSGLRRFGVHRFGTLRGGNRFIPKWVPYAS